MATEAGCEHYVRNCLLKAPCCGKFYVCRFCHDDKEDHEMNRFKVLEIKCAMCKLTQEPVQVCKGCAASFGEYYCGVCHLYDKQKEQFHCEGCGICRIGPREKYFHCPKCNLCLANELQNKHKCIDNVSRQNCPVCLEDIHTSRDRGEVLPCGHMLHRTCFETMCDTGVYRCPLCMHSAFNMEMYWKLRDIQISDFPRPLEFEHTISKFQCLDCCAKSRSKYHPLGLKCRACGSYNTSEEGRYVIVPGQDGEDEEDEEEQWSTESEGEGESESDTTQRQEQAPDRGQSAESRREDGNESEGLSQSMIGTGEELQAQDITRAEAREEEGQEVDRNEGRR